MLRKIRHLILILGDIGAAYLSLLLTVALGFWGKFSWQMFYLHLFPFSILYICWLLALYIFELYNLTVSRDKFLFYPRLVESLILSAAVGIAFFYLWPAFGISPKTNLILNITFFGGLLLIWRKIFYKLFSERLLINAVILGKSKKSTELAKEISSRPYLGYRLKKVRGLNNNLVKKVKEQEIDLLIAGENLKPNTGLSKALYQGLTHNIPFLTLEQGYEVVCRKIPLSFLNDVWFLNNLKENSRVFQDKSKRLFDLFFSSIFLVLNSPLWALIALAIKLEDKGPIFYKQKRVGKSEKIFWLIKFRSMKVEAEKKGAQWAKKNDERATRVGKFLRRSHLDELPQLLNVLKGELSLVGPRPERPEFVKKLKKQIPHYTLRHLIKPGITGWDQIKFKYARTVLDSLDKFEYDLYYLKNRNLLLDFGILLKTFQSFFRKTD